jgi:hypothetical protein
MLWLDVGLWSGYKRSMEMAGSFLQPLYTARTQLHSSEKINSLTKRRC